MWDKQFLIRTCRDLEDAVGRYGIVPLFENSIAGFSVEEHAAPEAWFESEEGVWEWKGPVIRNTGCAYGKFFEKKAAFVSREWFPDLANMRRDGYDADARYEDGLMFYGDWEIWQIIDRAGEIRSRTLKRAGGYGKNGKKGFDTSIVRLQTQCYVTIADFVYEQDKTGRPYGWGVGVYTTPEHMMGKEFTDRVYRRTPQESRVRLFAHLQALFPDTDPAKLAAFLK